MLAVANIEFAKVLNWCNAVGFSTYAEEGLKRYCLWRVTWSAQHRGNLYRNSQVANQLETIVLNHNPFVPADEPVKELPHPLVPADAGTQTLQSCPDFQWAKSGSPRPRG